MKLIIDDANIEKIKELYSVYPIDGVTTNPSIIARNGRQPFETLREIRAFIGSEADLHVQVTAEDAEGMLEDAHRIQAELGSNTYIKVPVTREGLKAIKALAKEGANITGTTVYTRLQAYLAAKAGAHYVAPYVNRIDNLGADGVKTVQDIHDIFWKNGLKTEVLAASFKNCQQVQELCQHGIGAATIAPDIIEALLQNDAVAMSVAAFTKDFAVLCGEGKTMKNCL